MLRTPCLIAVACLIGLFTARRAGASPLDSAAEAFVKRAYERVIEITDAGRTPPEGRLVRARALVRLGRYGQALLALARLEDELPHVADLILYLRGEAFATEQRFEAAAAAFAQVAQLPESRWVDAARRRRAETLLAARHHREAVRAYELLLKSYPDHPDRPALELSLAEAYDHSGEPRRAAERLKWVWLEAPASDEADSARKHLDRLTQRARRAVEPPRPQELLARARRLRRAKRFDAAIAQYRAAAKAQPSIALQADAGVAYTLLRAGRMDQALGAYRSLLPRAEGTSWYPLVRRKLAETLADRGRLDEALALFPLPRAGTKRLGTAERRNIREAARLAAWHGQYKKALDIYRRREPAKGRAGDAVRARLGWLAYRAGAYDLALEQLGGLTARFDRPFALYWQARAHARAGRAAAAEALYNELVEEHLRDYYGQLARSRLVEAGKLELASVPCATAPGPKKDAKAVVDELVGRYGKLLPELERVRTFVRTGMLDEARRELLLLAVHYARARYRGRHPAFQFRAEPLRRWKGAPLARQRGQSAREREIVAAGDALSHGLAELAGAIDMGHLAWRLGPRDPNDERRKHPRAYHRLVVEAAERFQLDPNLVWAIIRTESAFRLDAISRVGAAGLMQIMPTTAERLAKALDLEDFHPDQLFDPEVNILLGTSYLAALVKKFRGQIPLLAAAYNGGPHNVARWLDYRGAVSDLDEFIEEIPLRESRRYAKKIVRLVSLYERAHCGKDDHVLANRLDPTYDPYPDY